MKLLEALVYPYKKRKSFLNRSISHRALIEDLPGTDFYRQLECEAFDFWEVFYRHNNYFLEKNSSLLNRIKNNQNFKQASMMNDNSIGFENFIEFFDRGTNSLSSIGVRVCSLIDIIRFMRSLSVGLKAINDIVKNLANRFKVDIEIIERVFRASEDNMSLLLYRAQEKPAILKKDVLKRVLQYLTCRDGLELVLMDKTHFEDLKEYWISTNLRILDNLNDDHELRMEIWMALVPDVGIYSP